MKPFLNACNAAVLKAISEESTGWYDPSYNTALTPTTGYAAKGPLTDQIGLIVSDIEMPEMDGYTLSAKIRSEPELAQIKVILHTSLSGVFNQSLVKKVGADNFVAKYKPDELAKAIKDLMVVYDR